MSNAKVVTEATFTTEVLESSVPVVVDFYADWCQPCRMLAPILDSVAGDFQDRAKIVKVNIDNDPTLASQFSVSSIPTLAFVVNGEVVGQAEGLPSEQELRDVIQQMVDITAKQEEE